MDLVTLNRSRPEVRQMGLMMPPRAGGAQGGEGGRGASSWVVCGVGATAWASPQTTVVALGGVGRLRIGNSGAPTGTQVVGGRLVCVAVGALLLWRMRT